MGRLRFIGTKRGCVYFITCTMKNMKCHSKSAKIFSSIYIQSIYCILLVCVNLCCFIHVHEL